MFPKAPGSKKPGLSEPGSECLVDIPQDSSGSFLLLQRICSLVVLLCFLHIFATAIYYVMNNPSSNDQELQQKPTIYIKLAEQRGTPEDSRAAANASSNGQNQQERPTIFRKLAEQRGTIEDSRAAANGSSNGQELQICPEEPPHLVGPLRVEFSDPITLDLVRSENSVLQAGGRFRPPDCTARQKVAMIIPFRNQDESLKLWLYYLHPILQRQQLDYGVYVINQDGEDQFNRAKLLNIGYVEALKEYDYDCFVFSDVDLIPMDDRNLYMCYSQPRHLAVLMDKFDFRLPYTQYFGGASSLSKEQFLKINGFPNNYWGWGGEEDDISIRISSRNMSISRPDGLLGRCRIIPHERDKHNDPNPQRFDQISQTRETMATDGINSLKYNVVKIEKDLLFTKITVDVGKP